MESRLTIMVICQWNDDRENESLEKPGKGNSQKKMEDEDTWKTKSRLLSNEEATH